MRNFKDLQIWKLAYEFNIEIYKILPTLPERELRNIFDQLQRASTSIPLNIAEGSRSESGRKFFNYLHYAYASSAEVEVLLMMCAEFEYISNDEFKALWQRLDELNAKLYSFMKAVFKDKVIHDDHREGKLRQPVPFQQRVFSYGSHEEKGVTETGEEISEENPHRLAIRGEGRGKEKLFF